MEAFSWPRGDLSTMKHAMEPLVFISYRQADSSATAPWLAYFDQAHFGPQHVFIDAESAIDFDETPTTNCDSSSGAFLAD
jgi:hypothetical protein